MPGYTQYFQQAPKINTSADYQGPEDSFLGPYFTRILLGPYERPTPFQQSTWEPDLELRLPLPTKLRDMTSVSYAQVELQGQGDLVYGLGDQAEATGLRGGAQLGASAIEKITGTLGRGKSRTAQGIGAVLGGITAAAGANGITPENIAASIQEGLGKAPNPNISAQFKGPQMRAYSYTWPLYPRTKDETAAILNLITQLKRRSLPSVNHSASAILLYPDLVQVNFFPWDAGGQSGNYFTDKSFVRYKRSFITSIDADFNPFGTPAFHHDSQGPATISLTINFQEAEYLTAEDWESTPYAWPHRDYALAPGTEPTDTAPNATPQQVQDERQFEQNNNVTITHNPDGSSVMSFNQDTGEQ